MSGWQIAGMVITFVVLIVGLLGPAVFTWRLNTLCDEYDRITKEQNNA
jgi:hypothetical protein